MFKVLVTGKLHNIAIEKLKKESDIDLDYRPDMDRKELLGIVEPFDCIITRSETPVDRELIDQGKNLKVIARAAVGVANIDINYATEKGILVINTPGKNTNSAAELTFGILLAAVRKICHAHSTMGAGGWDRHRFHGIELRNKTLGIIGLGNVGHRMAKFANGFDMTVLAYDPYINDEVFFRNNTKKMETLDDLLRQSDVVSLHVPKNKETTGMIAEKQFQIMKDGVIIVNAARGGVVTEDALLKALKQEKVSFAAIDTWEVEPVKDNKFKDFPNVVMTPHIGASTEEAQLSVALSIAEQVPRALRGDVVDFPVNAPNEQLLFQNTKRELKTYMIMAEKMGVFAKQYMDSLAKSIQLHYRGDLAHQDCTLIKQGFLKGYLKSSHENTVYTTAEETAKKSGIEIIENHDRFFTDYESAVKFTLKNGNETFEIGGVVFSGYLQRLTKINDYLLEFDLKGTILVTINEDKPGMVGHIGKTLGKNKVNIVQFTLSRNLPGGEAMALISIDNDITQEVINKLLDNSAMKSAKRIVI